MCVSQNYLFAEGDSEHEPQDVSPSLRHAAGLARPALQLLYSCRLQTLPCRMCCVHPEWHLLLLLSAVFAYGQTGSGKTYTMGSAFTPGGSTQGVIPSVMDDIFARISSTKDADYTVRVGFVEIHQVNKMSACITVTSPQTAAQQPGGASILRPLLLSCEHRALGSHLTLGGLGLLSPLAQLPST